MEQPRLSAESFLRAHRRFLATLLPAVSLTVTGAILLAAAGVPLRLPFERVITVDGRAASKAEFFQDQEVQRILLEHHISVEVTRDDGSRELATGSLDGYDFAFASGTPSATLITERFPDARVYQPFLSPLALGTYRPYAEALVDAGIAAPHPDGAGDPLYYALDTAAFLDAIEDGQRWSDLGVERYGVSNDNPVLAHTSDVCESNSGAAYLSLVAYTENGGRVPDDRAEAERVARNIRPLLAAQGMETSDRFRTYKSPEGRRIAPVVVIYEHEYLGYQTVYEAEHGRPDADRVLLYPDSDMMTQPQFVALTPEGERVLDLLIDDPDLRRRATELGYRVLDPGDEIQSDQLDTYLADQGVPVPPNEGDTRAPLPDLPYLEPMLQIVGRCEE